jgi:hypothetical protein
MDAQRSSTFRATRANSPVTLTSSLLVRSIALPLDPPASATAACHSRLINRGIEFDLSYRVIGFDIRSHVRRPIQAAQNGFGHSLCCLGIFSFDRDRVAPVFVDYRDL